MIDNNTLANHWRHKLYMLIFYVFVFVIIVLEVIMQPTADVPAPIIFGVLAILVVDSLYHEVIVRAITGKPGHGMIRSGLRILNGKNHSSYLGLLGSLCAGLLAWAVSLEVFNGTGSDFLIRFLIGSFIGTHWNLHKLHDKVKELEKR